MWTCRPTQLRFAYRQDRPAAGFQLAAFLRVGEAGERSASGGGGTLRSLACILYTLAHPPPTDDELIRFAHENREDTRIACSLSSLLLLLVPLAQSHSLMSQQQPIMCACSVPPRSLNGKLTAEKEKMFVLLFLGVVFIRKIINFIHRKANWHI